MTEHRGEKGKCALFKYDKSQYSNSMSFNAIVWGSEGNLMVKLWKASKAPWPTGLCGRVQGGVLSCIMVCLSVTYLGMGVGVFSLHPGVVATELNRYTTEALSLPLGIIFKMATSPLGRLFLKTAVQGAQTTIHCAVAEELKDETGLHFRYTLNMY